MRGGEGEEKEEAAHYDKTRQWPRYGFKKIIPLHGLHTFALRGPKIESTEHQCHLGFTCVRLFSSGCQ